MDGVRCAARKIAGLLLAIAASGCGRLEYAAGRDGAAPADEPDASVDCTVVIDGTPCAGGVCSAGACCTGCISVAGCEPGDVPAACGGGGSACAACSADVPVCGARRRCMVEHAIVELGVGQEHQCARDAEGRVYCWGSDRSGQLGAREPSGLCSATTPLLVPLPMPARSVRPSNGGTCAVLIDGSGWCWGRGPAGGGTTSAPSTCIDEVSGAATARASPISLDPVEVVPSDAPSPWLAIVTGRGFAIGLNAAGVPYFWGAFAFATDPPVELPIRAPGAARTFVDVRARYDGVGALTATGDLYFWGSSWVAAQSEVVPETPHVRGVRMFEVGHQHACWVFDDGLLECDGVRLEETWAVGPTGGRIVPRTDPSPPSTLAISYSTAPAFVCWTNAALELWCTYRALPLVLGGTEQHFEAVTLGNTRVGALDATGRAWLWYHYYPDRADRFALPP
jgi:hypothetical protein